jgi:hypothetical protein
MEKNMLLEIIVLAERNREMTELSLQHALGNNDAVNKFNENEVIERYGSLDEANLLRALTSTLAATYNNHTVIVNSHNESVAPKKEESENAKAFK